jgi:hypothetical protein
MTATVLPFPPRPATVPFTRRPANDDAPVLLDDDSRDFLLMDLSRLRSALDRLAERVATEDYDPLPGDIWHEVLSVQDTLCGLVATWPS